MEINKQELITALEAVRPGLATKEMVEQSTSFCFIKGRIITFNDNISVSYPFPDLQIKGVVDADKMYNLIKKLKTEEISIEESDNELLFKAGRVRAGLRIQSEIVLPIEEIGRIKKWKPLPDDFLNGIKHCMGATSRNMSEAKFVCVFVDGQRMSATDRFRIAVYKTIKETDVTPFLIPADTCAKLIHMNPQQIAEGEGWIHFKGQNEEVISCRIFDEKFPDVLPHTKFKGSKILFPKSILDILDKAGVFSKRDYQLDECIIVRLQPKKIEISSESETGWFRETARVDYQGEEIEFKVTPYLLRDILTETNEGLFGENRILFKGENWKYLTMLR